MHRQHRIPCDNLNSHHNLRHQFHRKLHHQEDGLTHVRSRVCRSSFVPDARLRSRCDALLLLVYCFDIGFCRRAPRDAVSCALTLSSNRKREDCNRSANLIAVDFFGTHPLLPRHAQRNIVAYPSAKFQLFSRIMAVTTNKTTKTASILSSNIRQNVRDNTSLRPRP